MADGPARDLCTWIGAICNFMTRCQRWELPQTRHSWKRIQVVTPVVLRGLRTFKKRGSSSVQVSVSSCSEQAWVVRFLSTLRCDKPDSRAPFPFLTCSSSSDLDDWGKLPCSFVDDLKSGSCCLLEVDWALWKKPCQAFQIFQKVWECYVSWNSSVCLLCCTCRP